MTSNLTLSSAGRRYGLRPKTRDGRDRVLRYDAAGAAFPPSTNNRVYCTAVKDQGQEGSCTAHAGTSNWEFHYKKLHNQTLSLSRQFLYYKERELEGTLPADNGAEMRTICRAITKFGVCTEISDPYDISTQAIPPTPQDSTEALKYRSGGYHWFTTLSDVKGCLTDLPGRPSHPFMIGFLVYSNFESQEMADSGLMPMPTGSDMVLGGHAVLAVDYDDSVQCPGANPGAVLIQNSWGTSWGIDPGTGTRGFFWMAYDYLLNPDYVSDMVVLHTGSPWK